MDTPVLLSVLPWKWRTRLATAMAKEFFKAHFFPEQYTRKEWFTNSLNYWPPAASFNAFRSGRREAGAGVRRCATSASCSATAIRCCFFRKASGPSGVK